MDDNLARLKEIGFTRIGRWTMVNGKVFCELSDLSCAANVLYAFAVEGELVYIGKTVQALSKRLRGYCTPGRTQTTNIKNHKHIRSCISRGKTVDVYMLPDNGLMFYGRFHLNLAAGLEDSLVRELLPAWNGGKKEPVQEEINCPTKTTEEVTDISPDGPRSAAEFQSALYRMLNSAAEDGSSHIDVSAGGLHRRLGGYPGANHRMPMCCAVMRKAMMEGDHIMKQPPKGAGASLLIRYVIPRKAKQA